MKLAKRHEFNYHNHKKEILLQCDRGVNYPYNGNHITTYKCLKFFKTTYLHRNTMIKLHANLR